MRSRSRRVQKGGLVGVPNIAQTVKAAVKAEIETSSIGQQALAAKRGIDQLTTALPDAVQGVKDAVGEQLEAQKEVVKSIVDDRIAAAGLQSAENNPASANNGSGEYENDSAYANNGYTENEYAENEGSGEYEGGGRVPRRRAKKISGTSINKMASRRETRRNASRKSSRKAERKSSRKAERKASRKAERKASRKSSRKAERK
jgi:hypothetical protein